MITLPRQIRRDDTRLARLGVLRQWEIRGKWRGYIRMKPRRPDVAEHTVLAARRLAAFVARCCLYQQEKVHFRWVSYGNKDWRTGNRGKRKHRTPYMPVLIIPETTDGCILRVYGGADTNNDFLPDTFRYLVFRMYDPFNFPKSMPLGSGRGPDPEEVEPHIMACIQAHDFYIAQQQGRPVSSIEELGLATVPISFAPVTGPHDPRNIEELRKKYDIRKDGYSVTGLRYFERGGRAGGGGPFILFRDDYLPISPDTQLEQAQAIGDMIDRMLQDSDSRTGAPEGLGTVGESVWASFTGARYEKPGPIGSYKGDWNGFPFMATRYNLHINPIRDKQLNKHAISLLNKAKRKLASFRSADVGVAPRKYCPRCGNPKHWESHCWAYRGIEKRVLCETGWKTTETPEVVCTDCMGREGWILFKEGDIVRTKEAKKRREQRRAAKRQLKRAEWEKARQAKIAVALKKWEEREKKRAARRK